MDVVLFVSLKRQWEKAKVVVGIAKYKFCGGVLFWLNHHFEELCIVLIL